LRYPRNGRVLLPRLSSLLRAPAADRWLGRGEGVAWVIGEGRSGTTWLANLIASFGRKRILFEPFHPGKVTEAQFMPALSYRREQDADAQLEEFATAVFSGSLQGPWVDKNALFDPPYDGLVVKDIFASLVAKWVTVRISNVRPVLIVRNPFSVAKSKQRKTKAWWVDSPAQLLRQGHLVEDHLSDVVAVLEAAGATENFIIRQVAIWASVHHVLFRQFSKEELLVVFYESLLSDPLPEVDRLTSFLGCRRPNNDVLERALQARSRVSSKEGVRRARNISEWREGLTEVELAAGQEILSELGLAGLYDEAGHSRPAALELRPGGIPPAVS
jgi:hypothetical protein